MLKSGEVVWAWDFVMGKRKPKRILPPTKGILSSDRWSAPTKKTDAYAPWFIPYTSNGTPDYLLVEPVAKLNISETEQDAIFDFDKALDDGLNTMLENIEGFLNNYINRDVTLIRGVIDDLKSYIDED